MNAPSQQPHAVIDHAVLVAVRDLATSRWPLDAGQRGRLGYEAEFTAFAPAWRLELGD